MIIAPSAVSLYCFPVRQGNPFFDFFKHKKNLEWKYGHFYFKSAFGINFRLWEVVKQKINKYVYLHIFSLTTSQS